MTTTKLSPYAASLDARLSYSRMIKRFQQGAARVLTVHSKLDSVGLIEKVSLHCAEDFTLLLPVLSSHPINIESEDFLQWQRAVRLAIGQGRVGVTVMEKKEENERSNQN
jgi:hypothetical protein